MSALHQDFVQEWLQDHELEHDSGGSPSVSDTINHGRAPSLVSETQPISFTLGNGESIIRQTSEYVADHVEHELLFVTCFWAKSQSSHFVSQMLLALSQKAISAKRIIRVRLCLSSVSVLQKIFHTTSTTGKLYRPEEWVKIFGLPSPERLVGLDLQIKSIFVTPFSVMHPKFILIDRQTCLLPSCNVSWENWFEGCLEMRGAIVDNFFHFWSAFWGQKTSSFAIPTIQNWTTQNTTSIAPDQTCTSQPVNLLPWTIQLPDSTAIATFLPSGHHRNPQFRPFPCHAAPNPRTPLNTFVLGLIKTAQETIFIQTPNLTAMPVIQAIEAALRRGVNVRVVTNQRLMRLEQLVTAGTTTPQSVKRLMKAHQRMLASAELSRSSDSAEQDSSAIKKPGELCIGYFTPPQSYGQCKPRDYARRSNDVDIEAQGGGYSTVGPSHPVPTTPPVKTHLKLTIVDRSITVLGSGNMDRASWVTSQEIGIALLSRDVAVKIREAVEKAELGMVKAVYESTTLWGT